MPAAHQVPAAMSGPEVVQRVVDHLDMTESEARDWLIARFAKILSLDRVGNTVATVEAVRRTGTNAGITRES
jgi:hypothetical protein